MSVEQEALAAYADWLGFGPRARAGEWLARLALNRPEISAFASAPTGADAPYLPQATIVQPADGAVALAAELPADAPAALDRARSASDLKAFTYLPATVGSGGPGLLAGVPVVVKDLMSVKGMPLTAGSKAIGAEIATKDAEVVARLKRAGAVVVGLANLHEFAYGITSANPHFGAVVNPAARDRIPGGSSGGSAAAVAAGVARLAIGTDTAGSIRIPAACCGIVGFKPSYDALPRSGVLDLGTSLDHVGPMTANVADAATMFAAMLGAQSLPAWAYRDLRGIRAARLRGFFDEPLDEEVRGAVDAAMAALAKDGANAGDAQVSGLELAAAVQFMTICAEAGAVHMERVRTRGEEYGEDVRVRVEIANFLPGHWYAKAQRMRSRIVAHIEAAFDASDVLVCATLRVPAPAIGASHARMAGREFPLHTAVTQLTMPFNLSGLPAVSVPWTRSRDGVPVCLQVVAPRGRDWRALAVAQRLQHLAPWPGAAG